MRNILIIGGTTFIGPCIADHLLARGYSVSMFNRGNRLLHVKSKVLLAIATLAFQGLGTNNGMLLSTPVVFYRTKQR